MTDWIHCNKCFLRYDSKFKFYITTCGHIKCEKCALLLRPEKQCLVCNSTCDLAQLSNSLKPDIQIFFRPYNELDHQRKQIYTFQYENAISLLKKTSAKYNAAKDEIRKQYTIIQELKKQNAKFKMMVASAARGGFAVSTPTPGVPITPMNAPSSITPVRNTSGMTPRQINDYLSRYMPRNKQKYSAEITGHQHNQVNYASSKPVPAFGNLPRSTSFTPARNHKENTTPENPAMISFSRLQFGANDSFN